MDSSTTALFIGRFQPFHLGHLDAVRQIFADGNDFVVIGIGSSQVNHEKEDPFTAGERWQMIYQSLIDAGYTADQFHICPLTDIEHNSLWPHFVMQQLPPFGAVYSGSPWVLELFRHHTDKHTKDLGQNIELSATHVREQLLKNQDISQLVPPATEQFLAEINATKRLQNVSKKGF